MTPSQKEGLENGIERWRLTLQRRRRTAKVLKWINKQRKSRGLKPLASIPRGTKCNTTRCPVALGLGNLGQDGQDYTVLTFSITSQLDGKRIIHPPFVTEWIQDFDDNGIAAYGKSHG